MIQVQTSVRSDPAAISPAALRRLADRVAQGVLAARGVAHAEVSVVFVDDAEMAVLNERYRRREGATDVLSFAARDVPGPPAAGHVLGDVVVSVGRAALQARQAGHSLRRELALLLIHGLLHLPGLDHEKGARRAAEMRRIEAECLEALGPRLRLG